jgi:hypothetical protein
MLSCYQRSLLQVHSHDRMCSDSMSISSNEGNMICPQAASAFETSPWGAYYVALMKLEVTGTKVFKLA